MCVCVYSVRERKKKIKEEQRKTEEEKENKIVKKNVRVTTESIRKHYILLYIIYKTCQKYILYKQTQHQHHPLLE